MPGVRGEDACAGVVGFFVAGEEDAGGRWVGRWVACGMVGSSWVDGTCACSGTVVVMTAGVLVVAGFEADGLALGEIICGGGGGEREQGEREG